MSVTFSSLLSTRVCSNHELLKVFRILSTTSTCNNSIAAATALKVHRKSCSHTSNLFSNNSRSMSGSNEAPTAGYKKTFGNPLVVPFLKPSVWTEIVGLTIKYQAVNLGQGFPDYPPPPAVKQALLDATEKDLLHQYTKGFGHPRLVKAISQLYSQELNRTINADTEILVTTGAYESLYSVILSLVGPGDEVIILEPFFDCYDVQVGMAGAKPVYVPLHPPTSGGTSNDYLKANDWNLNLAELEAAFTDRTKLIIVNTPNNPLGKVFSQEELNKIADLCKRHDVVCVSDEVYEWMVYEPGLSHLRMANVPGMWERTLTVCSAGKTFNTTGWKLGWTIGPENLLKFARGVHQNAVYTNATMLQEALAIGIEHEMARFNSEESYFKWIRDQLKASRDFLANSLKEVGFQPHLPQGGYFIMAGYSDLPIKVDTSPEAGAEDFQIVRWLIKEKNLTAIPVSAFYSHEHKHIGEKFLRFCFIKNQETLDKAAAILKQWKSEM